MPDYPWWFGVDNEYTLKGAIATGRKDITLQTIDLIRKFSEQGDEDGRIIHEVSTNGVIFNAGNVNETPQFSSLIRWVYDWTGERDLLTQNYPIMRSGLNWLLDKKDSDGNLFPDGYGMMEIHGLNSEMIDVAVYTQRGLVDAAYVAGLLGEQQDQRRFERLARELKEKINKEFWVEEMGAYADFIGTPEEALVLLEDALVRADTLDKPWAVAELKEARERIRKYPKGVKRGFVLYHNWVVNTPMEMGIAPQEKGIRALDKGAKFTNPFGVFVTGIDRDERADEEDGSFSGSQVFSYVGAVMTLPTGVQAVAENNYGRPNQALDYLQRMTRSFSFALPGSIYEVSPDYGMMTQAWNLYSYAVPVITQFLGVRPKAAERHVELMPHLPDAWQPGVSIERLPMGDNELTVKYKWKDGRKIAQVEHSRKDWTTSFAFPAGKYNEILLNGTPQEIFTEGNKSYIKTDKTDFILEILL
ncbi:alpha-L-rhamnosidase-related protein [Nitritalea halalkaliphila]|uniref:alpha-L-rhamnosidase-related protein n=1 Tax=Nitritalea halalkaliphila TaxID=590849 RepID=UPI000680052B|nr:hypothetical protein [Nitritalea halalkaliphila]